QSAAYPGDTVEYTVTVTNTGTTPASGALFVDDLSDLLDDATFLQASATIGTVTYDGTAQTLTLTGALAVNESTIVTGTVRVKGADVGNNPLVNAVTSTAPGAYCPSTCATDTPVGHLAITKTATPAVARPGETVTYRVTASNTGQVPY